MRAEIQTVSCSPFLIRVFPDNSFTMPGTIQTQQTAPEAPQCRGIYHLTHPRSASNLFQTMMAKQPGFEASSYKLFEAGVRIFFDVEKGPLSTWPEEERKELQENFQKAFDEMQDEMEEAEKKVSLHVPFDTAGDAHVERGEVEIVWSDALYPCGLWCNLTWGLRAQPPAARNEPPTLTNKKKRGKENPPLTRCITLGKASPVQGARDVHVRDGQTDAPRLRR